MNYLKGFSIWVLLAILVSASYGYVGIYMDQCSDFSENNVLLDFNLDSCDHSGENEFSNCFSQNVLITNEVLVNFNASSNTLICQLEVTGTDLLDLTANIQIDYVEGSQVFKSQIIRNDGCEETKYFIGEFSFEGDSEELNDRDLFSENLYLNSIDAKLNSVKLTCIPSVEEYSDTFDTLDGRTPFKDIKTTWHSIISGTPDFNHYFEYKLFVPKNHIIFSDFPSSCIVSSNSNFDYLICNRSTDEILFDVTPLALGDIEFESSLTTVTIDGFETINLLTKTFDIKDKGAGEALQNLNELMFKTEEGYRTVSELKYADKFLRAEVRCLDSASTSAKLLIRNMNSGKLCNFYSNNNLGNSLFSIDLTQNSHDLPGNNCTIPFELDRSGLYSFDISCQGNSCSGSCPYPVPYTSSFDWTSFLQLGKYFHSFYGSNQIPDCVCNSGGILTPIEIFSRSRSIDVEDVGGYLP